MKISQRIRTIVKKGYFPKELPPPFKTDELSRKCEDLLAAWDLYRSGLPKKERDNFPPSSRPVSFDMARVGFSRRLISIPNPINQIYLTRELCNNWKEIGKIVRGSKYSITKIDVVSKGGRAIVMMPFSQIPEHRIVHYASHKYIIQTDVSRFYHSIYTHSIPWALHGKKEAKKNRSKNDQKFFGNMIDFLVRQGQDGQTVGIPVGPDTSRIISEIILSAVDKKIEENIGGRIKSGFRYIDDMFFCFDDAEHADEALKIITATLREFELEINPSKTKKIEYSDYNEDIWAHDIQRLNIEKMGVAQRRSIVSFFSSAIDIARNHNHESIINYALKMTTSVIIWEENWDIYEAFMIRVARSYTNCMDVAVKIICTYAALGYNITENVDKFVNAVICDHAPVSQHYEVAWALWLSISLKRPLSNEASRAITEMNNSICYLMAMHLNSMGLVKGGFNNKKALDDLEQESLYGENWLLFYEGVVQGWIENQVATSVSADPMFAHMINRKIKFYDQNAFNKPVRIPTSEWRFSAIVSSSGSDKLNGNVRVSRDNNNEIREESYEEFGWGYEEEKEIHYVKTNPFLNDEEGRGQNEEDEILF